MNTFIKASIATCLFVAMFFVGRQIDLSDQVLALYQMFQDGEAATQKASLYDY